MVPLWPFKIYQTFHNEMHICTLLFAKELVTTVKILDLQSLLLLNLQRVEWNLIMLIL